MINYSELHLEIRWLKVPEDSFDHSNRIADLPAQDSITISAYPNHRFIVVEYQNKSNILHDFLALKGIKKYSIGRSKSSFVNLNEIIIPLMGQPTKAMSAKFKSLYPYKLHRWYDDGNEGIYQGYIAMGQEGTINTYESHVFYYTLANDSSKEIARFTMNKDQYMYVIHPTNEEERALVPQDLFAAVEEEIKFGEEYRNKTGHFEIPFGQ